MAETRKAEGQDGAMGSRTPYVTAIQGPGNSHSLNCLKNHRAKGCTLEKLKKNPHVRTEFCLCARYSVSFRTGQ